MIDAEKDTAKAQEKIDSLRAQLLHAFEELDLLHSVCDIFSSSTDPEATNKHILSEAIEVLGADMGWIFYNEAGLSGWQMLRENTDVRTAAYINEKVVQSIIKNGEHKWTDDLAGELGTADVGLPKAFLCVPLKTRNEVLGAICVGKYSSSKVFTAGDLKLVQILCAPAANAILQKRVERTNELKKYLSPRLAEMILAREDIRLNNKRAELTVFSCALKGFSEAIEELEPEELIEILNLYFSEMSEIIFSHEGTLDKFALGSIFGFFGEPVRQEDHAIRAAKMAVEMQSRFSELQRKWVAEGFKPFGLGIGINTGYVTVGNIGSPNRMDYTAIGKNAVVGAKLADLAEHGQIICGQRTFSKIKDQIEAQFLGLREIGRQHLRAYEIRYPGQAVVAPGLQAGEQARVLSGDAVKKPGKEKEDDRLLRKGRISHYEIVEKLGMGGVGQVYKARDLKLNRIVALKILSQTGMDETSRRRFEREAKALSALNHPNIATIYEVDEEEGISFIAMEYIGGKTFKQIIEGQRLTIGEVLILAIDVAEALSKTHHSNIIHRDIKPSNIILSQEGYVKILDFGLAKLKVPTQPASDTDETLRTITEAGIISGTVRYMSPEQAKGVDVDHRSDIFSFGVVLYEMLTGKAPFTGKNTIAVIHAIVFEEPPPIGGINREAAGELERIVNRSLEKEPAKRYQTMKEMLVDLRRVRENVVSEK